MQDQISFTDFKKIQLAVGLVLECEKIEWSDKLYKLQVRFGGQQIRTILSGISQHYTPAELINKKFIFIVNLEPKKIRDIESQGMILACDGDDGKPILVAPIEDVVDGSVLH